MPELPEVETTVRGLKKYITRKTITDVWTDWPKYFRRTHKNVQQFRRDLVGRVVRRVSRKGKNILIYLSGSYLLVIHQKLSGHLMVGRWSARVARKKELSEKWRDQKWVPANGGEPGMLDVKNRFIRLLVFFEDGDMLAFSDLRRFGKIMLGATDTLLNHPDLARLGPEPLDPQFTSEKFLDILRARSASPVKQLLLNQHFISGIGNIYADEALWLAKLHPKTRIRSVTDAALRKLFLAVRQILTRAIVLRGTSIDDFRDINGKAGGYALHLKAYQKEGLPCPRCATPIQRIKIGSRSARFCPKCQPFLNETDRLRFASAGRSGAAEFPP